MLYTAFCIVPWYINNYIHKVFENVLQLFKQYKLWILATILFEYVQDNYVHWAWRPLDTYISLSRIGGLIVNVAHGKRSNIWKKTNNKLLTWHYLRYAT